MIDRRLAEVLVDDGLGPGERVGVGVHLEADVQELVAAGGEDLGRVERVVGAFVPAVSGEVGRAEILGHPRARGGGLIDALHHQSLGDADELFGEIDIRPRVGQTLQHVPMRDHHADAPKNGHGSVVKPLNLGIGEDAGEHGAEYTLPYPKRKRQRPRCRRCFELARPAG